MYGHQSRLTAQRFPVWKYKTSISRSKMKILIRDLPYQICMQPSTQEDGFNYDAAAGSRAPR